MTRNPLVIFVSLVMATSLVACATPLRYSAEPIEATVIDAETRKPLEGVIVAANWQLEEGTLGGNVQAGQLMVMETVTDKDGKFRFPGFEPKTVWRGHLVNEDPQLLLFKSGYEYKRLDNNVSFSRYREYVLKPVRSSDWNERTIALKPFKGTAKEYAKHLSFMSLSWAYNGDDCEWKKIPRLVIALHEQADAFRNQGVMTSIYTIESLIPYSGYADKCGAREYFRDRRP